jgi:predicted nucleic acid-binding protein
MRDDAPDAFYDLALEHSNDELMALLDVSRDTVRAWRKATGLHRPRGRRTLPPVSEHTTDKCIAELAREHGWRSISRFSEALRESRPAVYAAAKANGLARRGGYRGKV